MRIFYILVACVISAVSCKKNNTSPPINNPNFTDTSFQRNINPSGACGANFSFEKTISINSGHAAAAELTQSFNTTTPGTVFLYKFVQDVLPGDGMIHMDDLVMDVLSNGENDLEAIDQNSAEAILNDGNLGVLGETSFIPIDDAKYKLTIKKMQDSPLKVEVTIKILEGNYYLNTSQVSLNNANLTFKTVFTFIDNRPCMEACIQQFHGKLFKGISYLYNSPSMTNLLYTLPNDSIYISYDSLGGWSFLQDVFEGNTWRLANNCNLSFRFHDPLYVAIKSESDITVTTDNSNTVFGKISNDSIYIDYTVTGILHTNDPLILATGADTTNATTYFIKGRYKLQ